MSPEAAVGSGRPGVWGFILVTNVPSGRVLITWGLAGVAGRVGGALYLLLTYTVNLKLFEKVNLIKKETIHNRKNWHHEIQFQ